MMNKPDFLHTDANSSKLKVDWGGRGHKWVSQYWS